MPPALQADNASAVIAITRNMKNRFFFSIVNSSYQGEMIPKPYTKDRMYATQQRVAEKE